MSDSKKIMIDSFTELHVGNEGYVPKFEGYVPTFDGYTTKHKKVDMPKVTGGYTPTTSEKRELSPPPKKR